MDYTRHFKQQLMVFTEQDTQERCGLVVDHHLYSEHLIELPNRHEHPELHFAIHSEDIMAKLSSDPILAVFHTHLRSDEDGPSRHDLQEIKRLQEVMPKLVGMVYVVPLGLLIEYSGKGPTKRRLIAQR